MTPLTPSGSIEGIYVASKEGAVALGEGRGVLKVGRETSHNDDSKVVGCGVGHELSTMLRESLERFDFVGEAPVVDGLAERIKLGASEGTSERMKLGASEGSVKRRISIHWHFELAKTLDGWSHSTQTVLVEFTATSRKPSQQKSN
jgi:hypothetical protein